MIRILFLLFFLVYVQNDEPVLSWNAAYKLSWKDFKGKPKINDGAVAITASGITFNFSITKTDIGEVVSFTSNVHAHFYPEASWYKIDRANDYILGHEQLHFDITELFARKFRYRISQLKVSNTIWIELKTIHNRINLELSQMQNRYDNETNFSRNPEAQIKWKTFVGAELDTLFNYESVD